ncbi:MAG TPA: carboxypeptidase-like regulatory domain-containing protein, partial [Bacteroidales bacterium]|nr:carboxypeptidase-like regulatory domain-containing protein [Bacteroidales bacterium]
MKEFVPNLKIITGFLFLFLFTPGIVFSQSQSGRVLSSETNLGIGYVNIGIIGKNVGTVANGAGDFTLILDKIYNNDSLRFSMIGYESKTLPVSQFKKDSVRNVYLKPVLYSLQEVKVIFHKTREIKLGTEVVSNDLRSGFAYNDLSSELGIKLHVKGLVKLEDIALNVAVCTYDSVTYRLNIYQSDNQVDYKNIMT